MDINELSSKIISAAIEVHKALGPGLLESAYEECLCYEFRLRDFGFERQKPLPIFRCLLLFSALSAESHKKIYLSVLCVSAVNYCNIFKCIVPLIPEATVQATMQDERIKKIVSLCELPRSREEIQTFLKLKNRDYFRKYILNPLIKRGILSLTIPDKPRSPEQKYYSTKEKK